jgi:hypothetical protein
MADEQADKDFAALQAKMLENNGKMKAVRDEGGARQGLRQSKRTASTVGCVDGLFFCAHPTRATHRRCTGVAQR